MTSANRWKKQNAFGATSPPFIDYLKDILRRYPDGGQILKELIQNADDAGATEVVFIHDERTYGTETVWTEDLVKYQGPALYAFNNAEFTEEDWRGIQSAGRSVKRNDPNRVGRFGIGFNSVYHITDLPCIFSAKHLAVLDPQEKIFGERNGGFRWSLCDKEEREALLNLHDQFQPFQDILGEISGRSWEDTVGEDQHFCGTLFRFPLRNEPSEISDNLYNSEKVVELFDCFIADAELSLLFLTNVSSVALIHIHADGTVNIRLKVTSSSPKLSEVSATRGDLPVTGSTCYKNISISCPSNEEARTKWLVTTCHLKEGKVSDLDSLAKKLCFHPLVHVAFPLDTEKALTNGRLSCFLPLPNNEHNRTGLTVHINACFGLTDNRRHIKWQEEDQKYDEAAMWNELLVKEVLPHAYEIIILDAIHISRDSKDLNSSMVYHIWPDVDQMEHKEKWRGIAMDFLQHLLQLNVLYLARDDEEWVKPSEAVFIHDENTDAQMLKAVADFLISEGEKLVYIPRHISRAIQHAYQQYDTLSWVTPTFVRKVLHKSDLTRQPRHDKLLLLEYVLGDGRYQDLEGLKLLPVSDGSFKSFTNDAFVLIDSVEFPRVLLPTFEPTFLPEDVSGNVLHHLKELAQSRIYKKILCLNVGLVTELALNSIPKEWQELHGHVTWEIGNRKHPTMEWLKEFWKFLAAHFRELDLFIKMPLIPLEPILDSTRAITLARLQKKSTLIFQNNRQTNLPEEVTAVIQNLGGTVIPQRDECLNHQDLETYVSTPSAENFLNLLLNLDTQQVIGGMESASFKEKEELKSYLSTLKSLTPEKQCLVSKLPVFQSMPSLTGSHGEFLDAQSKKAVIPNSIPAIPENLVIPDPVIRCATEADRRLLTLLNIQLLNPAQAAILMIDGLEKRMYKKQEANAILTWILENGSILFNMEYTLYLKCKGLCFLELQGGKYAKPSHFFDPGNETFRGLFDSDYFPPPLFTRTTQMLESLKQLGLKTRENDIRPNDVLHIAKQIESSYSQSWSRAILKAETLIGLCNRTLVFSNFSEEQILQLLNIQWFPCNDSKILTGSDNENAQVISLYKLEDVRHLRYSQVVGHVMPLTDEITNNRACQTLRLLRKPPADKVLENISVLKKMVVNIPDPDADVHFKETLHSIYKFMQENIEDFKKTEMIKTLPWLWITHHFVSPHDVVLSYPVELDLCSFIERVPEDFQQYRKLLTAFGVKISVTDGEVEEILHSIKQNIEERHPPHGNPSELKVVVGILNWMRKGEKSIKDDLPVPVMVGGQEFNLQPLSSTVFCDISEERLEDLRDSDQAFGDQEVFHVIHGEVPTVTANWLKIPFLSTRLLNPEIIGIEQCGQTEPITLRVKNILKEYNEDKDLFKELIQNAEDSGANICRFMVDLREHKDPPESLIDQGMSLCHGPCLWAFNNELFTDEDWRNITRVGFASKEKKVEKIGRFGLGFNTVYHVTDIPSILSGNRLLIFDPNVTHLKKHIHSNSNPGIKLDLSQARLFHMFPGQFRPYQGVFDCDFSRDNKKTFYQGTLIKLPFRTPEEAATSEISQEVYDETRISAFQRNFMHDLENHLLFLKNIHELSFHTLPKNVNTLSSTENTKTLTTVTKKIVKTMTISELPLQEIQKKSSQLLTTIDEKCHNIIDCSAANIIEVTSEHVDRSEAQYWLLYSCFGLEKVLGLLQEPAKNLDLSLPVGGIAVPLRKDQTQTHWIPQKDNFVGKVFCFLPLSIDSGLPVHINGSFSVTSNRKNIWATGVKGEWNQALLQDSIANAYITSMLVLKQMSQEEQIQAYDYYTFWPDMKQVSKSFEPLAVAFYHAIVGGLYGNPLELFSNGEAWCTIEDARFLHPNIEQNEQIRHIATNEFLNMNNKPYLPVPLPQWVRKSFIWSDFEDVIQYKTFDWLEFYQEVLFKNLRNMDHKNRDALVLHALDMNNEAIDELLKHHPCIPTQGGKQLQFIRRLVNPHGKVAELYDLRDGCFPAEDFLSSKRIHRLSELGMLNDSLPFDAIVERAQHIDMVWKMDKKKAYKSIQLILELAGNFLTDSSSPLWKSLKDVNFIPAHVPYITDDDNTVTVVLKKPTEIYSYGCLHLVCLTEPFVDQENFCSSNANSFDSVLRNLGVITNPPLETLHSQLMAAWENCENLHENLLLEITAQCYKYLDKFLRNTKSKKIQQKVHDVARRFPFIFIEMTFISVRHVAWKVEFDARPYLYELPKALSSYKRLWNCVGIKEQFTSEQYLNVIRSLNTKYSGKKLSEGDLKICLQIVVSGLYKTLQDNVKECLLPDEDGVLRPSSRLCYNDSKWLPPADGVILCHDHIPRTVAMRLKVKTTRHHTLEDHIIDDFSHFEQKEKLTIRIRNIISAYPSKKDIVKELVQNADDAQASEIHFVWDGRKHGTTKTFGEHWNALQGPALCVYNNALFSEVDLKGIQQLGEGGKRSIPGKTGKHGLGFNSVYHLTDCPTILTGKHLCILDPNKRFLEVGKGGGGTLSLTERIKQSFTDVYDSHLPQFFPLDSGTMFRLPVRTREMAEMSDISNKEVTIKDVKELHDALAEDPENLILFLRHIRKIQFHQVNSETNELQEIFTVQIKLSPKAREEKKSLQLHIETSHTSHGPILPCQIIYQMDILTSSKKSQWIIAERMCSQRARSDSRIAQAAVAACLENPPDGRAFCCLPLPGKTGLPVHVNGNFEVDSFRRDLWKEDGKNMKTEWNEFLKLEVISPLYADLLNYMRTMNLESEKKYVSFKKLNLDLCASYLTFFPHVSSGVAQEWQKMIYNMYTIINEKQYTMIPVLASFPCSTEHLKTKRLYKVGWTCVSAAEQTEAPHFTNNFTESFLHNLEVIGMNLVPFSQSMQKISTSFKEAGVRISTVSPNTVREYLKQKPLNDSQKTKDDLPLPVDQTLLKDEMRCKVLLDYCMKDINEENSHSLYGLPLLLTQDKFLRHFQNGHSKFLSKFVHLFQGSEDAFADYRINVEHFDVLQQRNLLEELTIPISANYLKTVIKKLLQNCEIDPQSRLYVPDEEFCGWLKQLWMYIQDQVKPTNAKEGKSNKVFSDMKELFSDSPIVPVQCPSRNNKRLVVSVKGLSSIVSTSLDDVAKILFNLGFMTIDPKFFSLEIQRCHLISEQLNPSDRTAVLQQLFIQQYIPFDQLEDFEMNQLLSFLQSGIKHSKNPKEYEGKLRSLPLFETVHGSRQKIDGNKKVFILNTELMDSSLGLFLMNEDTVFLKNNITNLALSHNMNIKTVNDLQFFVNFVLPSLNKITEDQVLCAIRMLLEIQNHSEYSQYKKQILSSLRQVKFITDISGNLQMASFFFDEEENLYKVMLPKVRFIPTQFWTSMGYRKNRLKNLLKDLGLRHIVSDEELIQFAQKIESDANGTIPLEMLKKKSAVLLETILNKKQDEINTSFLHRISRVKFIFPQNIKEELCKYHKPCAGEQDVIAIQGSLIEKDSNVQLLVWTSMPILPSENITSHHRRILLAGGAVNQPPTKYVIQNIRNICAVACQAVDPLQTRAKVLTYSYAFLQTVDFDATPLREVPLVLVEGGAALVKPSRTVLMIQKDTEFRPYLYKLPPKFTIYLEFFEKVGVAETPSVKHYSNVLEEIHNDSADKQTLNANQVMTVKRTIEQLFLLFKEKPKESLKLAESSYLPARDGRLYPSRSLYFNDTTFQPKRWEKSLEKKLKLLEKLDKCHLGTDVYEHHKLIQLLPCKVRPHLLSEVLKEDLLKSSVKMCEYKEWCEFRECFRKNLSSSYFLHGLVCLIRQQCKGKVSENDAVSICLNIFDRIQIICCETLETVLLLNQEPLENTSVETQVYVRRDPEVCTFYLKHSDDLTPKVRNQINLHLTSEINILLNVCFNSNALLVLNQLLFCDSMKDVSSVLEKNGILDSSTGENWHSGLPDAGSCIAEEWIGCLDMDFMNNFEKGEYVGFKKPYVEDELYYYAIIVDRVEISSNQQNLASCRYKIQIGPDEFVEVSSLDLYQFKRGKKTSSSNENPCRDLVLLENILQVSPSPHFRVLPQYLEEIKREIDKCLREIWSLPEDEKRKAIRRLYLKWHPDKNPECVFLATEAYKYLKQRIQDLEQENMNFPSRSQGSEANQSTSEHSRNFSGFYQQWDQEASRHQRGRERFQQHHSYREYNFWDFHGEEIPRPNKAEARRWHRQAECDLTAAQRDIDSGSTEWCLFKVHQAVEKALISAALKKTGKQPADCTITHLAEKVSLYSPRLSTLSRIVKRLKRIGVDAKKTQYPNYHPSPHIPNDQFFSQDVTDMLTLAADVLSKINAYIYE